ncbi:predicted protein [Plenodomus lingam JN3]|uniref:Predicted protein n=1 Tax=Leptosphaeria maculans (strain JN3 / isolate v23.1.3 / race Av1-4-5-6-7-8) TaxID=985895 RepID=E4ZX81_LEPMJ|nr:predicted protein [Plenodomus lingam JN3]CBX95291.1 predicted protein [Plenodomus lingam JN3]
MYLTYSTDRSLSEPRMRGLQTLKQHCVPQSSSIINHVPPTLRQMRVSNHTAILLSAVGRVHGRIVICNLG